MPRRQCRRGGGGVGGPATRVIVTSRAWAGSCGRGGGGASLAGRRRGVGWGGRWLVCLAATARAHIRVAFCDESGGASLCAAGRAPPAISTAAAATVGLRSAAGGRPTHGDRLAVASPRRPRGAPPPRGGRGGGGCEGVPHGGTWAWGVGCKGNPPTPLPPPPPAAVSQQGRVRASTFLPAAACCCISNNMPCVSQCKGTLSERTLGQCRGNQNTATDGPKKTRSLNKKPTVRNFESDREIQAGVVKERALRCTGGAGGGSACGSRGNRPGRRGWACRARERTRRRRLIGARSRPPK